MISWKDAAALEPGRTIYTWVRSDVVRGALVVSAGPAAVFCLAGSGRVFGLVRDRDDGYGNVFGDDGLRWWHLDPEAAVAEVRRLGAPGRLPLRADNHHLRLG